MDSSAAPSDDPDGGNHRRRWWLAGAIVVILLVATIPLLASLNDLETVELDPDSARERLADRTATPTDQSTEVLVAPSGTPSPGAAVLPDLGEPPIVDGRFRSFLVIGGDHRAGVAGDRADVIIVGLLPNDGSDPIMFSLPRDLWLDDPCRGGHQRINAAYNGCPGVANGFEMTSIVVENFTGVEIDHVVSIDFEGFIQVIDAVGGVEICVDHPVRDGGRLNLPAGCTMAGGELALGWVRSRKTQELVEGEWRTMPGVNDLTRNRRQQDIMLQLLGRVGSFGTVSNLYSFAEGVSDSVALGAGLNVADGVRLAWSMRGRSGDIQRFAIPVADMTTSAGAQVLLPTEPFATTFERETGIDLTEAPETDAAG